MELEFNKNDLLWEAAAKGVWKSRIDEYRACSPPKLLDFARPARLGAIDSLPGGGTAPSRGIQGEKMGNRTLVSVPLSAGGGIFGLGLNHRSVNQRGKVRHLRTDHYFLYDDGRSHAPAPVFFSDEGFGFFVDTCEQVSVYAATSARRGAGYSPPVIDRNNRPDIWDPVPDSRVIEISFEGGADIYFFEGPTAMLALQRYNLFCGGGCLPPKWGLGSWYRVHSLLSDREILTEVEDFARRGFPLDVLGLEPGWQSCSYPSSTEWDNERFPDPEHFLREMESKGIKINLWEQAFLSPEAPLAKIQEPVSGSHLSWCGFVPDYTMESAREALCSHHAEHHLAFGVSGYKLDECDGFDFYLWPDHAEFPSGVNGLQMRQLYALSLQKANFSMFEKLDRRTYGLIRASNAGGNGYPYAIYNDCYSFSEFLIGLINSGFIGQLWVPEVRSANSAEEFIRRFQMACFSPMLMLDAWFTGLKPWSFPEAEDCIRELFCLRRALLPYIYSAFAEYYFLGVPPVRSIELEFALTGITEPDNTPPVGETDPYPKADRDGIKDQYVFGSCLMVAPVPPGLSERTVVFPRGIWYNYYTGEKMSGGCIKTVPAPLHQIPLFVREGGIIPLKTEHGLDVQFFGSSDSVFKLYDDDGETFGFEKGDYCFTRLTVTKSNGSFVLSSEQTEGGYTDGWGKKILVIKARE